jgi:hypothetical protein
MSARGYAVVVLLAAILIVPPGCGDSSRQQELESAELYVRISLDAWTKGANPNALEARATPIEFHDDDWQSGAGLDEFEIIKTYHDTDGQPRCAVTLSVRRGDAHPIEQKVTYQIVTIPRVVIARDPYS